MTKKNNVNALRGLTLLTAGAILCLGTSVAQCQRAGRAVSRAATSQTTASQGSGGQGSASQMPTCTGSSSSQTGSASTTTQSNSTVGATTQNGAVSLNAQASQVSRALTAQRTASNQLLVQWSGNTSNVQRVYLGTLDANGRMLTQRVITQSPVQASLTLTAASRYYAVQVIYSNGTASTAYSPIR